MNLQVKSHPGVQYCSGCQVVDCITLKMNFIYFGALNNNLAIYNIYLSIEPQKVLPRRILLSPEKGHWLFYSEASSSVRHWDSGIRVGPILLITDQSGIDHDQLCLSVMSHTNIS